MSTDILAHNLYCYFYDPVYFYQKKLYNLIKRSTIYKCIENYQDLKGHFPNFSRGVVRKTSYTTKKHYRVYNAPQNYYC